LIFKFNNWNNLVIESIPFGFIDMRMRKNLFTKSW